MMNYPTNFSESNVLLAMSEADTETAEEILAGMSDLGIKNLHRAAAETMKLCSRVLYEREQVEKSREEKAA